MHGDPRRLGGGAVGGGPPDRECRGIAPRGAVMGIGIASGEAIIGNIGSPHHMSYTIIGDAVNTAARLMQMARGGELLVSGNVYDSIAALIPAGAALSRGNVALRGKTELTAVHSIELSRARTA